MKNNLAFYASVMNEMKQNGWNVHLFADIAVGKSKRLDHDEADWLVGEYKKRIEADAVTFATTWPTDRLTHHSAEIERIDRAATATEGSADA